jgi:Cu-Zn family superoxide dismutase
MTQGTIRSGLGAVAAVGLALLAALMAAGLVLTISSEPSGATKPLLRATLLNKDGLEVGHVVFKGQGNTVTRASVHIDAGAGPFGTSDFHGFHVHTIGVCDPDPAATPSPATPAVFGSAGGHWNPTAATHGGHKGDMPSVLLQATGKADAEFATDRFAASELLDANGSAVILHAGRDNFANIPTSYSSGDPAVAGPNAATNNTGDAGGRYACGVVVAV